MQTIQEQILSEIGSRLGNIKVSNGYFNDIPLIKAETIGTISKSDIPVMFYWGETDVKIDQAYGYEKRSFEVGVAAFTRSRDDSFTMAAYDLAADIKTAVNRSTTAPKITDTASVDLGSLVDSLVVGEISPIIGQGQSPFCGVVTNLIVTYYSANHDSYTIVQI